MVAAAVVASAAVGVAMVAAAAAAETAEAAVMAVMAAEATAAAAVRAAVTAAMAATAAMVADLVEAAVQQCTRPLHHRLLSTSCLTEVQCTPCSSQLLHHHSRCGTAQRDRYRTCTCCISVRLMRNVRSLINVLQHNVLQHVAGLLWRQQRAAAHLA